MNTEIKGNSSVIGAAVQFKGEGIEDRGVGRDEYTSKTRRKQSKECAKVTE